MLFAATVTPINEIFEGDESPNDTRLSVLPSQEFLVVDETVLDVNGDFLPDEKEQMTNRSVLEFTKNNDDATYRQRRNTE